MKKNYVFTIVILLGAYLICQAIADIGATKMVSLGKVIIPGGTFIFALTFTLRDLVHKRLGKKWATSAIIVAGIMNILQSAYLYFVSRLPYPPFFANGVAWEQIFNVVPAITIASIIAEVTSELIDTEVYHLWWHKVPKAPQWSRVLISNVVSLPIDSAIFGILAFTLLPPLFGTEAQPILIALQLASGQILYKAIITVVSLPFIYLVKEKELDIQING